LAFLLARLFSARLAFPKVEGAALQRGQALVKRRRIELLPLGDDVAPVVSKR
jgi:hypothetical protein